MNVTIKWSINTVASNLWALYSCILGVTLSWFPCLPIKGGWNKHGFILSRHPVGRKVNPQLGRLVFLLSPPPSSWQPLLLLVSPASQSCQPECVSGHSPYDSPLWALWLKSERELPDCLLGNLISPATSIPFCLRTQHIHRLWDEDHYSSYCTVSPIV